MAVLVVYGMLLLIACTTSTSTQMCGLSSLENVILTEETFKWKLHNVYSTTVMTRIDCSKLCNDDEQCNGMIVCPGVCHLFGVFYLLNNVSHLEGDHQSCNVFNMNRCKNKGFPDENGYCVCTRGYGGPFCENTVDETCYTQWTMIHDTTKDNSTFAKLKTAMTQTCHVQQKVLVDGARISTVDASDVDNDMTWAQSVYSLRKSSWKTFADIPARVFVMITNADLLDLLYVSIEGRLEGGSQKRIHAKWFVKNYTDGIVKLQNSAIGISLVGDYDAIVSKIDQGSALATSTIVFLDKQTRLISEDRYRLGREIQTGTIEFVTPPVWVLKRYTNAGSALGFQWDIVQAKTTFDALSFTKHVWCTDDCWIKILTTDQDGNVTYGSKSALGRAVKSGHKLRIYASEMALGANAVYIGNGIISACSEVLKEKTNVYLFDSSGFAQSKMFFSTGHIEIRRFIFDAGTTAEMLLARERIDWFVDTREWIKILSVSPMEKVNNDSLAKLCDLVLNGASVRIVAEHSNGRVEIFEAHHLDMANNGHVAAEVVYQESTIFTEHGISFDIDARQRVWSAIITTEGEFRKYNYSYNMTGGYHENITDVERYSWFVQT